MSLRLDDLPDDVLIELMLHLNYKDVCHLCPVNKRLNRLANDNSLWYKLYLQKFGPPRNIEKLIEKSPYKPKAF